PKPNTCPRFFTWMKQQGALLAKGRITGLQFETLMEENRYVEYGAKAVRLAEKLREGLKEKGYQLLFNSTTNQTFVKLPDDKYQT
ncbi:low specificity L-threonine aldolase, partial [Acinetobacter baumannii]|nr:low specificity L-threonine aldolase [Acinetobacter baumannii]